MITIINILMAILMGYVNYNRDVLFINGCIIVYIRSHPHDLPRNILYGNYHVSLDIKHNRKNNNSQKGRSWGAGFCTRMFQYIWVVILISNACLLNGYD